VQNGLGLDVDKPFIDSHIVDLKFKLKGKLMPTTKITDTR